MIRLTCALIVALTILQAYSPAPLRAQECEQWRPLSNLTDNVISILDGGYLLGTCGSGIYRKQDLSSSSIERMQIDADTVMGLAAGGNATFYAATEEGIFRSTDGGATWSHRTNGLPDEPFTAVVSDSSGHVIALSTSAGPFRSDDDGMTWRAWSDGLPSASGSVLLRDYRGRALIGSSGRLYASEKFTEEWRALGTAPPGTSIRTLALVPRIHGWFTITDGREQILVTTDQGIFNSTDSAVTWVEHGRVGLPDSIPTHLTCEPFGWMYAGTSHGLYMKMIHETNGIWRPCTAGLGNGAVTALNIPVCNDPLPPLPDILPCGHISHMGMSGGRLYQYIAISTGVDAAAGNGAAAMAIVAHPNPFSRSITFDLMLSHPSEITLELYSPLGVRFAVVTQKYYEAGDQELPWNGDDLPAGIYLYRLRAGAATITGTIMHQR